MSATNPSQTLEVLITVKTFPAPSEKYREVVCTAGVARDGSFVRLFPIDFRRLPYDQQFKKYQWIEVGATKHTGRDSRKESYRPNLETLRIKGDVIPSNPGNWKQRADIVLQDVSSSIEELQERYQDDRTSLGIIQPREIKRMEISDTNPEWTDRQKNVMRQVGLFEQRDGQLRQIRKLPRKFQYVFSCNDSRCTGEHTIMIEDWELAALFWRNVDDLGLSYDEAAGNVRARFFDELCGQDKNTYFFMGNHSQHPNTWLVLGGFYPKCEDPRLL